jgi:hypothetical protein
MRGFAPGDSFLDRFRIKPHAAVVRNLAIRTKDYTDEMHREKISNMQFINSELTKHGMVIPGCARGTDRSAWLLPMIVADKMQFKEFAWTSGLAVFRGAT